MNKNTSTIREPGLAPEGRRRIAWAEAHMPVLRRFEEETVPKKPFADARIALCIHLEAKTARLALLLKRCGARVAICGSNPLSTQDPVAAALAGAGVNVHAWHGATPAEYNQHLRQTLALKPDLLLDDGADLIAMLHSERSDLLPAVRGATEETTTGLNRLRAQAGAGALAFPVIAVNDAHCKYLFDNRYGTGQSVWDGIMRSTNLLIAGKTVVVAGYGWCGRGVALRARGLGAQVIVTEVDPVRALEAAMEGYAVMPMEEAASRGDIFITVTGCRSIIGAAHFPLMKDGAILANAGHFNVEIDTAALQEMAGAVEKPRQNIEAFHLPNGRRIYLLGEGRLVNLAAGDGHPAEIMDLSFAVQFLALLYLWQNREPLPREVLPLPAEIDRRVARLKLKTLGLNIDKLTRQQQEYLQSWQ